MRESQALIERVRQIGAGWQHLELSFADAALEAIEPGQTLLVHSVDTYLRENWIPVAIDRDEGVLVVERPINQRHTPGDELNVMGPVGTAFPAQPGLRNLLLLAQNYMPTRLRFLLHNAVQSGASVVLVLTGQAQRYPLDSLPPDVEVVHNETDLGWPEQHEYFRWAEQVFAIANPIFWEDHYQALWNAAVDAKIALPANYLYGVFDLPLPCGTGACMACTIRTKSGHRYICMHGAAFDLAGVSFRR